MRLIDADTLTDYVTEVYEYDLCHTYADDYLAGRASAEHYMLEKIAEAPTIDAIPVEWLREKMRGYASALKSTELAALVTVMQMWEQEGR